MDMNYSAGGKFRHEHYLSAMHHAMLGALMSLLALAGGVLARGGSIGGGVGGGGTTNPGRIWQFRRNTVIVQ